MEKSAQTEQCRLRCGGVDCVTAPTSTGIAMVISDKMPWNRNVRLIKMWHTHTHTKCAEAKRYEL